MKRSSPVNPMALLVLIPGLVGLGLQIWLFSATDERGLLPQWHIAQTLLLILTALVLVFLFLSTRYMEKAPCNLRVKSGQIGRVGAAMGALGLLAVSLLGILSVPSGLNLVITALGVLAAVCLVILGLRPNGKLRFPLFCGITAFFMLYAVGKAQHWGTLPQVHSYLFPLLALVFLILSGYHRCELSARAAICRRYVFFTLGALFFCCVSLNVSDWPFYLGMVFWLVGDISSVQFIKEEA